MGGDWLAEEYGVPRGLENSIIDFLRNLYDTIGWLGVLIAMAIESAAIPLPSEVIMPLAGWFLVKDAGHSIWFVLFAGVIGALGNVIGSAITYWIGAAGGRPLLLKYGKYIFISPHHIEMADRWFAEKGEATVFFSRLLPVVRTFISLPAGIARMNFGRFLLYTALGSFPWSLALVFAGKELGDNWEQVRTILSKFDYLILALVIAAIAYYVYRHVSHAVAPRKPVTSDE